MQYNEWNEQKQQEYLPKAKAILDKSPRFSASVVVSTKDEVALRAMFPKEEAHATAVQHEFVIKKSFGAPDEVLKWFDRPFGDLKAKAVRFQVHDRLRVAHQGNTLVDKTGDPELWGPWLNEATIEGFAKNLFARDCGHDLSGDSPLGDKPIGWKAPATTDTSEFPKVLSNSDKDELVVHSAEEEKKARAEGFTEVVSAAA